MPLAASDRNNCDTLAQAFCNGDCLLKECHSVSTGQPVPVMCAVNRHDSGCQTLIPFAQLLHDSPDTLINPPHPDRAGFATQAEIWLNSLL